MDHATEPWTRTDRATYQAAREVLFTADASGRLAPSMKRVRYDEYRLAYQDLQRSYQEMQIAGASSKEELQDMAADVQRALADWMVAGYKNEVEDALQVINTLGARSSLTQSQNEAALLDEEAHGPGLQAFNDLLFASTYFAPISAIARETWMQAKVSFVDLDMAVGNSPPNNQWKAYLANRMGEVTFDYVVLHCIRPWFTPALYQRDDWRLQPEGTIASRGNGSEGLIPAYVESVCLAAVKNVTNAPTPPIRPLPDRIAIDRADERLQPVVVRKPLAVTGASWQGASKAMDVRTAVSLRGVSESDPHTMMRAREPSVTRLPPLQIEGLPQRPRLEGGWEPSVTVATRSGNVRKLSRVDLDLRHAVLEAYQEGRVWTSATQPEPAPPQIFVVGFGCEKIPLAPNPNVNYRWD